MFILAEGEGVIKTVDYVSSQSAQWLLAAGVVIFGGLALFFMRRMLTEASEVKKNLIKLDDKYAALNDKHMDVLMVSSATAAENAVRFGEFAKAVMMALDASTGVIRGNSVAMDENTKATKQQIKSGEATTEALVDLKELGEKTVSEVRRRGDDTDAFIRRANEEKRRDA
jgi:hypothetical protein